MRNRTLILIYTLGNILPKIIGFISISLFSFFLSKEDLGSYDLLINSMGLFIPLVSLQLGVACSRFLMGNKHSSNEINDIIKTVLIFSFFLYLLSFGFFLLVSSFFKLEFQKNYFLIILLTSFFGLLRNISRALGYKKVYSFSGVLNSLGILFFSLVLYFLNFKGLECIVLAHLFSILLTTVSIFIYLEPHKWILFGNYDWSLLKNLLHFSLPLIPNALSGSFLNVANRYLIVISLGIGANGLYAVACKIPSLLTIFGSVFSLLLQDSVFEIRQISKNDIYYSSLFRKMFITQITSAIVIMAFSKQLLRLLFLPIYSEVHQYIGFILVSVLLANFMNFLGIFYQAHKNTWRMLTTTLFGLAVNIAFTYTTIFYLGLFSPAIGSILGFTSIWLIRLYDPKSNVNVKFDKLLMIQLFVLFMIIAFFSQLSNLYLDLLLMLMSLIIFVFYNKPLAWLRLFKRHGV
jgi:O-antigen/teichoic acid export membrane protein